MTESAAENPVKTGEIIIPASLTPADAGTVLEELRAALASAQESGGEMQIGLSEEHPNLIALQLMIAAKRSADAAGIRMVASAEADASLNSISLK